MSLLEKTKQLLWAHRISPNKLLGQNFTIEPSVLERMVEYASLTMDDIVLDIGSGFGFLTRILADKCSRVVAVEADETLVGVLREQLVGLRNVEIIRGNVLKTELPAFNKVVSIPPYQISSKLVAWLFKKHISQAILVFQKEFVNRLVASVGSDDYGWLTVLAYYYFENELLDEIPKRVFYPEPQVNSIIIRLTPKEPKPFVVKKEKQFAALAQSLFTNRNRKVRNAVLPFMRGMMGMSKEDGCRRAEASPFRDRRPRELTPEDIGELANALVS
jgi:16S rRNA (adenine1518-N6/adenine1519-N6)-dimethyltransferase